MNAAISLICVVCIPELSLLSFGEMGNAFFLKLRLYFLTVNNGPYYAASNWARPGRTSQLAGHLTRPGQVLWPAHGALVPPGENSSFRPLECLIYSGLWIEWASWFGTSGISLAQPRDMIIHARKLPPDPVQPSPWALSNKRLLDCHSLSHVLVFLIWYWQPLLLWSQSDFVVTWL